LLKISGVAKVIDSDAQSSLRSLTASSESIPSSVKSMSASTSESPLNSSTAATFSRTNVVIAVRRPSPSEVDSEAVSVTPLAAGCSVAAWPA
jgi:hypothetical protein